jgi:hypothetical protein
VHDATGHRSIPRRDAIVTVFDLLFLVGALATIGTLIRVLYLRLRGRARASARLVGRLGIGAGFYCIALIVASLVQPTRVLALGAPNCFDDFCIAVESAVWLKTIDSVHSEGEFVLVSGRVVSRARGRRQRETDVRGVLIDSLGERHEVSERGERALRAIGGTGANLTDFVDPMNANSFTLVFDVPASTRTVAFTTAHGWFPGALIIGSDESFLHRPSIVRLPFRQATVSRPESLRSSR